jgi:AraC-like DNA-binding protein
MAIDITLVRSFVRANLNRLRKAQHVADELNCSLNSLKKSFYSSEKMSISRFIRNSRVERMKEYLAHTDTQCKVICLDLGIREDVGARLFKHVTGVTMEEFRAMHRGPVRDLRHLEAMRDTALGPKPSMVLTEKVIKEVLATSKRSQRTEPPRPLPGTQIQGQPH